MQDNLNNLLESCKKDSAAYQRLQCLQPYFEQFTYKHSAQKAVSQAQKLKKDGVIDDCHLAAHFIGEANLQKSKDLGQAFATCSSGCIEGCFHGVMEGYLSYSDLESFEKNINNICNMSDYILKRQCIHGAGHGIFRHQNTDLTKAIDVCSRLEEQWKQVCLGGVFMENMDTLLLASEDSLKKDLPSLCDPVKSDENLTKICFNAAGEGLMFYTGHDLERSKSLCRYVPPEYQSECILAAIKEGEINLKDK